MEGSHEQGRFHNCYRDHVARARAIWGICKRGSHLSAWWRWHAIGRFRLLPKTKWKPLKSSKQMSYFGVLSKRTGFPGGSDGKESACNVGDPGSIHGLGRVPGEGNAYPDQYSCLENSMNLYAEYIMWNSGLDEAQAGTKIARRNINDNRYTDDTTLMSENEEASC